MAAQQIQEIGEIDELDVGGYELVEVKHEPVVIENVPRRHPTAGVRSRCPYGCGKMVALRTIDYHRTNGCPPGHSKDEPFGDTSRKGYYCCGVCFMEFVTRTAFHEHLSIEHDVHPQIHEMTFRTVEEFKRFVRWLELKGGAHFRHKSGSKRRQRGKGIFMACNRSGFVNSNNATGSERDRVGPYRMGHTCTAYIHGTQHDDGHVTIEVCGDHYGHDVRMRLPPIIKSIIAQRQMEGESNADIIDYLRQHFLPYADENIYAQRACLVDSEELKTINVTTTRKWEIEGIPTTCEIWEEELLDMVGIVRQGVPRIRPLNEKTTEEIAEEQNWPRPNVFAPKLRLKTGEFVPYEMVVEGESEYQEGHYQGDSACVSPDSAEDDYANGISVHSAAPPLKKSLLSGTLNRKKDSQDEYSDMDNIVDAHFQSTSSTARETTAYRRRFIPKGTTLYKEDILEKLLFEIDSLRKQILESAHSISSFSLHYLLLRLKALRPMIGHAPHSSNRLSGNGNPVRRLPSGSCHAQYETPTAGSHMSHEQSNRCSEAGSYMAKMSAVMRRLLGDLARLSLQRSSSFFIAQSRPISSSPVLLDSIRDAHRAGTRIAGPSKEVMEGTTGAGPLTSVNLLGIESRLPTAETMKMKFDGIPYCELPIVYIKATKNNTLVTAMDKKNHVIIYTSCRLEGFKHARKKTTIAGQTTGVAAGQRLVRRGVRTVRVQVKGIGPGRMTCVKGLTVAGVNVVSITDHTPLKELGPRPRKIRRV